MAKLYKGKALEARIEGSTENEEEFNNLGLNYSYLRLLRMWFDNYTILHEKYLKCTEKDFPKLKAWLLQKSEIEIIITGGSGSGKTSLMNSMIPDNLQKNVDKTEHLFKYNNITCSISEVALDRIGADEAKKSSLVVVCIRFSEKIEQLPGILKPIVDHQPNNLAVVLTFADANLTGKKWDDYFEEKCSSIKDALKEVHLNEHALNNVHIAPAGYKMPTIKEDSSGKSWVMNVWLKCIESASKTSQSAMMIFINHFIYGGKDNHIEIAHKEIFRQEFLKLINKMIRLHEIDYSMEL